MPTRCRRRSATPEACTSDSSPHVEIAKGSPSSCECVVVKQELRPVERAQSIAELIVLEAALAQGITLEQAARHRIRCRKESSEAWDSARSRPRERLIAPA